MTSVSMSGARCWSDASAAESAVEGIKTERDGSPGGGAEWRRTLGPESGVRLSRRISYYSIVIIYFYRVV